MMWLLDETIRLPRIAFDALGMAYVEGEAEPADRTPTGCTTGTGLDIRAPFRWHHFVGDE